VEIGAPPNLSVADVKEANPDQDEASDLINSLTYDNQNPGKTSIGAPETSPFRIEKWEPGRYAKLVSNWHSREGLPYVDAIEIQFGRTAQDRLVGLELGKVDLAKIPPELARRAADRGVRLSLSQPDELLAMVFPAGWAATEDARVREALGASIDRASIVNFILQKNGEAAGGLLPQWSSGTAFLFSTAADPAHAKEIWAQIAGPPKLVLGYDSGDSLQQSVAERIVVNAREAGISLTAQAMPGAAAPGAAAAFDAQLIRLRMTSPLPRAALVNFLAILGPLAKIDASPLPDPASPQEIYDRERSVVDSKRVVPLVWLPQVWGLSARLRNWKAPGPGETWPLADVWLDGAVESETGKESR
jgi:ABC-type transport system substrate-binding protein